jgi:hypothetical protein
MNEFSNEAFHEVGEVALKPHLEAHGHHAVEWSYHFPLFNVDVIEADLDILIPEEKAPVAAREMLLRGLISHTRFSLAVDSSSVEEVTRRFLDDSVWIRNQLCRPDVSCGLADLENSPVLLRYGRDYFTMGFLSRLALMNQSSLKRAARRFTQLLRSIPVERFDEFRTEFNAGIEALDRALASAERCIAAVRVWRDMRARARAHPDWSEGAPSSLLERLCAELEEIAELLLGLMGKSIADAQEASFNVLDLCVVEGVRCEVETLSHWVESLCRLRAEFGLPSIAELSSDPELAAKFYERTMEVKRIQYRKWDLAVNLDPVDRGIDFWIGAVAAGISALFAFAATVLTAFAFQGPNSLSFTETGLIALSFFAAANVVIYIIKDRMKELLKVYVRRHLKLKGGRWEGGCNFLPPRFEVEHDAAGVPAEVLKLKRRLWWHKDGDDVRLRINECFEPQDGAAKTPSGTIKQVWKIPFDEILDTFDDSTHVLRLPSVEGRPQHVETLKRSTLPFRVVVRTRLRDGKRGSKLLDESVLKGNIVISGSRIVGVEADGGTMSASRREALR